MSRVRFPRAGGRVRWVGGRYKETYALCLASGGSFGEIDNVEVELDGVLVGEKIKRLARASAHAHPSPDDEKRQARLTSTALRCGLSGCRSSSTRVWSWYQNVFSIACCCAAIESSTTICPAPFFSPPRPGANAAPPPPPPPFFPVSRERYVVFLSQATSGLWYVCLREPAWT